MTTVRKKKAKVTLEFMIELDLGDFSDVDEVTTFTEAASWYEEQYEEGMLDITDYMHMAIDETDPELTVTVLDD